MIVTINLDTQKPEDMHALRAIFGDKPVSQGLEVVAKSPPAKKAAKKAAPKKAPAPTVDDDATEMDLLKEEATAYLDPTHPQKSLRHAAMRDLLKEYGLKKVSLAKGSDIGEIREALEALSEQYDGE